MKTLTIYLTVLLLSFGMQQLKAQQETTSQTVERLEQQKEQIISEEKAALKQKVETINLQLENDEITAQRGRELKEEAAKKHALNIENRIAIIENEIAWISRNDEEESNSKTFNWDWGKEDNEESRNRRRSNRTTKNLVLAAGFNNAVENGQSLNDADFKLAGSRFFEIGVDWRTRVFENSNWLRVRYGVSFQFNGLKPTDNRYFVEDGDMTTLVEYPLELDKSKFRMDNLVVPFHFEFGPSKKVDYDHGSWFSTHNKLKIGLGGYAGFNIGERQKLKYSEDGEKVKRKLKGDYNTNDLIYGLSGYLGWGSSALYVKYDLNPIFKEPNTEINNISVGLRFDID